ncbi:MAG: hypothetical protein IIB57_12170, partial [Planctomycetes bacterium]|nr:hypothetical protein [Planctomycetota bacterium]
MAVAVYCAPPQRHVGCLSIEGRFGAACCILEGSGLEDAVLTCRCIAHALCLAMLLCPAIAEASRVALKDYDRLRGVIVRAILQDSSGIIWLAADDGLWRWDNGAFVECSRLLPRETVATSLVEDDAQTLWVGTRAGLVGVDLRTYERVTPQPLYPSDFILALHKDRRGRIWAGGYHGVFRLSRDGSSFAVERVAGVEDSMVFSFAAGLQDELWLGGRGVVYKVDGSTVSRHFDDVLTTHHVRALYSEADGTLWMGTRQPGSLWRFRAGEMVEFGPDDGLSCPDINAVAHHPHDGLWFATERGIARWDGTKFSMLDNDDGMENADVHSLLVDEESQLWIGTYGGGISRLRSRGIRTFGMSDGLPHPSITALARAPDGQILVGTVSGLAVFDPQTFEITPGTSRVPVHVIFVDSAGKVWLTEDFGLRRLGDDNYVAKGFGPCLAEDAQGRLLHCYWGGLDRMGASGVEKLPLLSGVAGMPQAVALLPNGALLLGMENGLAEFRDQKWRPVLEGLSVRAIHVRHDGRVLLGTNAGLGLLENDRFVALGSHLRPTVTVEDIVETEKGVVWAASSGGLLRLIGDRLERFSAEYGLPHHDLHCLALDRDGVLFVGTSQGLTRIETQHLEPCETAPRLTVSILTAGGKTLNAGSDAARIPYDHRDLLIQTQHIGWRSTVGIRSMFRIVGHDAGWSEPMENGVYRHTDLSPGSYTLLAKVVNERGIESSIASVSFVIVRPFWSMWWFTSGGLITLAGVCLLGLRQYRYRLALLRAAEAANVSKSEFVSRMSHEIRTPLSIILGC